MNAFIERTPLDWSLNVSSALFETGLLGVFPGFHELLKNLCDNHRFYCELRLQQLRGMEPSLVDIPSTSSGALFERIRLFDCC